MGAIIVNFVDRKKELHIVAGTRPEQPYKKKDYVNKTKTMTPLTIEEIDTIKGYLWTEVKGATTPIKKLQRARNHVMFIASINLGLRASDLTMLRLSDVYTKSGKFREDSEIILCKTQKKHRLFFNSSVREVLTWYTYTFNINTNSSDYLFLSQMGNQISPKRMGQILKEFIRKAGVERRVATHTPRKTYARQLIERNRGDVDTLEFLQKGLGHSSKKALMSYTYADEDRYKEKVMELNL